MSNRIGNKGKVPPPVPADARAGTSDGFPRPATANTTASPVVSSDLSYESDEGTQQLTSPLAMAASEELRDALRLEIRALEEEGGKTEKIVELNARLALVFLHALGDVDACVVHCEQAGGHSVAGKILNVLAQGATSDESFALYSEKLLASEGQAGPELKASLACDWLFRYNSPEHAARLLGEALASGLGVHEGESIPHWALDTVYPISLSMLEHWEELAGFYQERNSPAFDMELAALAFDRLDDSSRAIELIKSVDFDSPDIAFYASNLHSQILLSEDAAPSVHVEQLQTRLEALELWAKTSAEINATRYALAQMQEMSGQLAEAKEAFVALTTKTGWSTSVAQLSALRVAFKQQDWKVVVSQLGKLSSLANEAALAVAHGRRRAEILECVLARKSDALQTWQMISENRPECVDSRRNILRLLIENPERLLQQVLKQASADDQEQLGHWRLAIGIQETRLGNTDAAATLAEQCLRASRLAKDSGLVDDLWTVSRFRALNGDELGVAKAYGEIVALLGKTPVSAPLTLAVGLLELKSGREPEAIALLEELSRSDSAELAPLLVLASIHRSNANSAKMRQVLNSIAAVAVSPDTQFDALVELGSLCIESKDHTGARSSLTRASAIRPKDASLLGTLAGLHENNHEWEQAVQLLLECAESTDSESEAASALARAGNLESDQNSNPSEGIEILRRALKLVPDDIEVLQACQRIYGELKQYSEQLAMYKIELEIAHEGKRRLALHLEIGRVSALTGEPPAKTLQAYQQALTLDPNSEEGLAGLLDIAQGTKNWNSIADAFGAAQVSSGNLEVLVDACRNLKDWRRYLAAQRQYIDLVSPASTQARLSVELAEVCESELGDQREAIACLHSALERVPSMSAAHASLRRLLTTEQAWSELIAAIDAELLALPVSEETAEVRVELWVQLAELYQNELDDNVLAVEAFESVLSIDSDHQYALAQLEILYSMLNRDTDLLRIKVFQQNNLATSESTRQIADLRAKTGDVDG
ncbi:MAG: tetratricopeptide repeat protein, partial [Kofleriaceae bacterium]|nr:tetratricopeptide repeat protein [Kofleriaceae bacterium]